ncbi:undecaprenyl-diphosphate phosphatase [Fulvivirga maritima]|uniref:undecaprenyl-diphosphate phosphatase n=1 Tax=Fulvivirga maritima TaxID=2904247 RepID=UPI002795DA30|nr:undecaprenyl-diphosphate phosphatase [Fulvivirga maritima]
MDFVKAPEVAADSISGVTLFAGFLAAFISGLLACQWMIKIVRQGKLIYFAVYCIIVALVVLSVVYF